MLQHPTVRRRNIVAEALTYGEHLHGALREMLLAHDVPDRGAQLKAILRDVERPIRRALPSIETVVGEYREIGGRSSNSAHAALLLLTGEAAAMMVADAMQIGERALLQRIAEMLLDADWPVGSEEIARQLDAPLADVEGEIGRLERGGFVERASPGVTLTNKGRARVIELREYRAAATSDPNGERLDEIGAALEKLGALLTDERRQYLRAVEGDAPRRSPGTITGLAEEPFDELVAGRPTTSQGGRESADVNEAEDEDQTLTVRAIAEQLALSHHVVRGWTRRTRDKLASVGESSKGKLYSLREARRMLAERQDRGQSDGG